MNKIDRRRQKKGGGRPAERPRRPSGRSRLHGVEHFAVEQKLDIDWERYAESRMQQFRQR